jgi:colanic acid biosynthesis protein WcaH
MFINSEDYEKIVCQIPIVCVDLLIIFKDKCLLLKRDNNPAKGQYWFPGGRIHKMETIEDACQRISKLETNLQCKFIRQIYTEETMFIKQDDMLYDKHTINICCELEVNDISTLSIDKYHSNFLWTDKIIDSLHVSVSRPMNLIGFE